MLRRKLLGDTCPMEQHFSPSVVSQDIKSKDIRCQSGEKSGTVTITMSPMKFHSQPVNETNQGPAACQGHLWG